MTVREVTDQDYFHYILDKAANASQLVSGPWNKNRPLATKEDENGGVGVRGYLKEAMLDTYSFPALCYTPGVSDFFRSLLMSLLYGHGNSLLFCSSGHSRGICE